MLTPKSHALSFVSNHSSRPWLFGAVASRILNVIILTSIKEGNLNTILVFVQFYKIISCQY